MVGARLGEGMGEVLALDQGVNVNVDEQQSPNQCAQECALRGPTCRGVYVDRASGRCEMMMQGAAGGPVQQDNAATTEPNGYYNNPDPAVKDGSWKPVSALPSPSDVHILETPMHTTPPSQKIVTKMRQSILRLRKQVATCTALTAAAKQGENKERAGAITEAAEGGGGVRPSLEARKPGGNDTLAPPSSVHALEAEVAHLKKENMLQKQQQVCPASVEGDTLLPV